MFKRTTSHQIHGVISRLAAILSIGSFVSYLDPNRISGFVSASTSTLDNLQSLPSEDIGERTRLISFITDIEGCAKYFDRFVEKSQVLEFEKIQPNFTDGPDFFPYDKRVKFCDKIHFDDDDILVCGGDMVRQIVSVGKS